MDSVAPEVNTTSRGRAPKQAATWSRASSMAARVARPSAWMRAGSPTSVRSNQSAIARRAAGRSGLVDAWSRYARTARQDSTDVTQRSSPRFFDDCRPTDVSP